METLFVHLLNISITASWLVLAVFVFRLIFKKAPKWIFCLLWGLVALRLVLPFSLESVLSLIPSTETIVPDTIYAARPTIDSGLNFVDNPVNNYLGERYCEGVTVPANTTQNIIGLAALIWLAGVAILITYTIISYALLRNKHMTAVKLRDNIYQCESVTSPFVLGLFRPRIYLPYSMDDVDMQSVIAHENMHIKRRDHLIKPLGFLILSVYWFNPIIWVAYVLLCRDIEFACDEQVIKQMNDSEIKTYSSALLRCSITRKRIAACPLAFGEVGVKQRIKSVLDYKKPAFWIIITAIISCSVLTMCFLTNPKSSKVWNIEHAITKTALSDTAFVEIKLSGVNYEFGNQATIAQVITALEKLNLNPNEISQNRSEDREKTNIITIKNKDFVTSFNFNSQYTELWIGNEIKPTLTYKVKNPNVMVELMSSTVFASTATTDNDDITIKLNSLNLISDRPMLEVKWNNKSYKKVVYGENFGISRFENGEWIDCYKRGEHVVPAIAHELKPMGKATKSYYLGGYDLSKAGKYRFTTDCFFDKDTPPTDEDQINVAIEFSIAENDIPTFAQLSKISKAVMTAVVTSGDANHALISPEKPNDGLISISPSLYPIFDKGGNRISHDELHGGQTVKIGFSGEVMESYPGQLEGECYIQIIEDGLDMVSFYAEQLDKFLNINYERLKADGIEQLVFDFSETSNLTVGEKNTITYSYWRGDDLSATEGTKEQITERGYLDNGFGEFKNGILVTIKVYDQTETGFTMDLEKWSGQQSQFECKEIKVKINGDKFEVTDSGIRVIT